MTHIKISEEEKERIREAVKHAESTTSGEIVPFFVRSSDPYEEIPLKSAVVFMAAPLLIAALLSYAWLLPFRITVMETVLAVLVMGIVGYLLPLLLPAYKRLLLSHHRMDGAVEKRALRAFVSEEVFFTENRTGILILISHFEHMVEVIGDTGINEKVKKEDWEQVVALILAGIKKGEPATGIVDGINKCGELLRLAGVDKPPDNPNELPDDLRTE